MEEPEVQCNECGWQGDSMDLVDKDDSSFIYCPDCGSNNIEDYEE